MPESETDSCLFRSFELSCSENDSWGCAMQGQSFETGEGTAADNAKARQSYEKACALVDGNEGFPACRFALSNLDDLGQR
jgi:TPR repeat protein